MAILFSFQYDKGLSYHSVKGHSGSLDIQIL